MAHLATKMLRQMGRSIEVRRLIKQNRSMLEGTSVTVVSATDMNPRYLGCVPLFIDFWLAAGRRSAVDFSPRVLVVGKLPPDLARYRPWCVEVGEVQAHSALAAQVGRLAAAAAAPGGLAVTTDIDMLPLSLHSLEFAIRELKLRDCNFAVVRDVLEEGQFAMCYALAEPSVWQEVLGVGGLELQQILQVLLDESPLAYSGERGGSGWYYDQELLYKRVTAAEIGGRAQLLRLRDDETGHLRLDRELHPFPVDWALLPLVYAGFFTDYHVHHPVQSIRKFLAALSRVRSMSLRQSKSSDKFE